MFTVVNLARWYGIDPSIALQGTNNRFIQRLSLMETRCDRPLQEYSLEELETLWQSAKRELRKKKS